MQLTWDNWDDQRRANHQTVNAPVWQDVEDAIRKLDGKMRTSIYLGGIGGDPYLSVGGGDGRYLVVIWTRDERNVILTDSAKGDDKVRLVVGGQAVLLPGRQIVGLDAALRAARTYLETREPDPSLDWIVD